MLAVMYDLDIRLLANGIIKYTSNSGEEKTIDSNKTLDAFDCYNIGRNSYTNSEFSSSKLWLKEALNRTSTRDFNLNYKILGLLSQIYYHFGDKDKAFDCLRESIEMMAKNKQNMDLINTFNILMVCHKFYQ